MKPAYRMDLFESEIDYSRAIIEMTHGVILLLDTEGRIMDCNIHLEKLSGQATDDLKGRNWRDILLPLDGKAFPKGHFRNTIASRTSPPRTQVYRLLTPTEMPLYLEFSFRVAKDANGVFSGVLVVGYDVTELVKHEQSLEKERFDLIERNKELTCLYRIAKLDNDEGLSLEELLPAICDVIPDAMQHTDRAAARIRLDERWFGMASRDTPSALTITEPLLIQGAERGRLDIWYLPEDHGGPNNDIVFLDEERHLARAVASHLALIIEKREAEKRRLELEQQLRHADRLATIGQLAAGVAHELNEPLGNILGFAQLAGRNSGLPDQLYGDLDKIVRSSLHAREIIKKLMLFGRPMPLQKIAVSLNKIVEDGLYFLEARCTKSGITVKKQTAADLPLVHADPSQLEQVLVNLVINAIQAMPQGGHLTIRTFSGQDHVHLSVADTGIGMSEEVLNQIFVPFFTTKDVNEGTGLGLSVVHGIVAGHNGTIDVVTEPDKGTAFTINLPLREA
jgi:two-component system NtrC family sensor kinase